MPDWYDDLDEDEVDEDEVDEDALQDYVEWITSTEYAELWYARTHGDDA